MHGEPVRLIGPMDLLEIGFRVGTKLFNRQHKEEGALMHMILIVWRKTHQNYPKY
jgi:hypothetical protein